MPEIPKAIYVGPEALGVALKQKRPDWDFVALVDNPNALFDGLNSGEIPSDVHIVVTLDALLHRDGASAGLPENDQLEQMIVTLAPYCLLMVVQYIPQIEGEFRERVDVTASNLGVAPEDVQYFFIDRKHPSPSMDYAVQQYIQHGRDRAVANFLDPNYVAPAEGQEIEETSDELEEYYNAPRKSSDTLGQVVAVTSSKGGSGKSTIAMLLATYIARASMSSHLHGLTERPLKVVMVDLDVRDGQIGFLTGVIKPTVLNMRSKGINDATLEETAIYRENLMLDLLLAPKRARLADDTPPEFYLELIQFLRDRYDYVILDTSVNYTDPLLEKVAYPIADQIVFVTDIVINSVYSMTRWVQEVTRPKQNGGMGISTNKIGIVVNKSISDVNMSGERIAKASRNIPVISVVPNSARLMAHAANFQRLEVVLRHSDIRKAIRRIAHAVVGNKWRLDEDLGM